MKLIASPALVFLILSLAATSVLKFSSPLFVFSLFNTIILAIVVGSYRPSDDEVDGSCYTFQPSYENKEYACDDFKDDNGSNYVDDDDDDDHRKEDWFSDGYDEDDDDSGSDGEIGWEDDDNEETDGSFRRRIEDFIAKVNKGWREEWLTEHIRCQQ
ncbi:conserved hypothetical protein [Ricinus communis]|uniref:Uncharacterized protein n=1 Tax=Ricinus communis TaxID=3988 RepID=B9RBU5_RICCO|nr:conserved hypothetical protein [Ricinus communis]|eukprot:XP_002509629.1 phosphopantothenoylcysteine decarboxylase subunit VHS3 [Ricinus communis]